MNAELTVEEYIKI